MLRFGTISTAEPASGLYRVRLDEDDVTTKLISVIATNTKKKKHESPLAVGEHVAVLMDEHLENGVIVGAVYSKKEKPAAGAGENVYRTTYPDGSYVKFDNATGEFTVNAKGDVKVVSTKNVDVQAAVSVAVKGATTVDVTAPTINLKGNVAITGQISVAGAVTMGGAVTVAGAMTVAGNVVAADVVAGGTISLINHKHPDVTSGGTTGSSIP